MPSLHHLENELKHEDGLLEGEWLNAHKFKFPRGESGRSKETLMTLQENSKRRHKVFYISKQVSRAP